MLKYLTIKNIITPAIITLGLSISNFINIKSIPDAHLLLWLFGVISFDFLTGFTKAKFQKQATNSEALKRTIIKFLQYGGAIVVSVVLSEVLKKQGADAILPYVGYVGNTLVTFIIYIELVSILENLIAIDKKSVLSKKILQPLHKLLTIALEKKED